MACPLCTGGQAREGCLICRGRGEWVISECPKRLVDGATLEIVEVAENLEAGLGWPDEEVRGWLHQPQSLVDAVNWFKRLK